MTPNSFDPATAQWYVGDARMRLIEATARAHADTNDTANYKPPYGLGYRSENRM